MGGQFRVDGAPEFVLSLTFKRAVREGPNTCKSLLNFTSHANSSLIRQPKKKSRGAIFNNGAPLLLQTTKG